MFRLTATKKLNLRNHPASTLMNWTLHVKCKPHIAAFIKQRSFETPAGFVFIHKSDVCRKKLQLLLNNRRNRASRFFQNSNENDRLELVKLSINFDSDRSYANRFFTDSQNLKFNSFVNSLIKEKIFTIVDTYLLFDPEQRRGMEYALKKLRMDQHLELDSLCREYRRRKKTTEILSVVKKP